MTGTLTVRVEHRGQRIDFVRPADAQQADSTALLIGVSDWFERGCIDQIAGHQQGESPSASISINNPQGQAANLLAYPLGATVTVLENDEPVLQGQCVRYSPGPVIELSIEV